MTPGVCIQFKELQRGGNDNKTAIVEQGKRCPAVPQVLSCHLVQASMEVWNFQGLVGLIKAARKQERYNTFAKTPGRNNNIYCIASGVGTNKK